MAMTLAEYSKLPGTSLLTGVVADYFLEESEPLRNVPWQTDKRLTVDILAMNSLPTVGWRKINAALNESTGTLKAKVEGKFIFGQYIDVDVVLAKAGSSVGDVREIQRRMSSKAMAYEYNDAFINGSPDSDKFKGLKDRITDIYNDGYTGQYVDGGGTVSNRGILYDTTERNLFLDNLNKALDAMAGHKASAAYMNSKMYLAIEAAFRQEKYLNQAKDQYDRIINVFKDVPLIRIGVKADQTTEIITNAEGLSGGTEDTSIYFALYGENEYLWGIQQEPLQVTDLGEVQTISKYRDKVEWVVGLAHSNPRSITRLYGLVPDRDAS